MTRRFRISDVAVAAAAFGGVVSGAVVARSGRWLQAETGAFRVINGLDERTERPVWVAMQLGSLGGSLTTAGVVTLCGHAPLGRRLGLVGVASWCGAKAVKSLVGRGRPTAEVAQVRTLGRQQSGQGYPSGHAAVSMAMASVIAPHLPVRVRPMAWAAALGVGTTRVYAGAHLQLDIVGGAALGIGTDRLIRLVAGRTT